MCNEYVFSIDQIDRSTITPCQKRSSSNNSDVIADPRSTKNACKKMKIDLRTRRSHDKLSSTFVSSTVPRPKFHIKRCTRTIFTVLGGFIFKGCLCYYAFVVVLLCYFVKLRFVLLLLCVLGAICAIFVNFVYDLS
jgi:hypothetical protein